MASTDLKLVQPGCLSKPGPIGRFVRLGFGALCIYYAISLWGIRSELITNAGTIRPMIWNGIFPGIILVSYVVNIGFSRAWKKWPAIISLMLILMAGAVGLLLTGAVESPILAGTVFVWELYVFSHLGLSFALSGVLATPGCEMRALYHLFSLITGKPTKEHHCPIGPLNALDRWENTRKSVSF